MSLISLKSGETASSLLARLKELGVEIETGCNSTTSIAYAANGIILRQKETVSTTEYVGLTSDAAKKLEDLDSDKTTSTVYYKQISDSLDYAAVAVTTGTKVDYVPSRVDEGDAWHVVKTETTYAAASDTGWSATRPSAASGSGIIVSQSQRKTFLTFHLGGRIYQYETVVVREYQFLTLAEAQQLCSSLSVSNANVYDITVATSWSSDEGITGVKNITIRGGGTDGSTEATDTVTDMRYEGPERGWVVTATSTTYRGATS